MNKVENSDLVSFRERVERVLHRSNRWVAWQRALEATFIDECVTRELRVTSCVDTSLIIEYLLPGAPPDHRPRGYPRALDLALLLLFAPGEEIRVLPPHRSEFEQKLRIWKERLKVQTSKLEVFRSALDRLLATLEETGSSDGPNRVRQILDAVLLEERNFGGVLALDVQGQRSIPGIQQRMVTVALDSAGPLVEPSAAASRRIDDLYGVISASAQGSDTPFNNRVDAHAIYLLEAENRRLPADECLVLLTQSGKIWSFLANQERRKAVGFDNSPKGIWLIQTPEIQLVGALMKSWQENGVTKEAVEKELSIDLVQNRHLRIMRDDFESEVLPNLEEIAKDPAHWSAVEARLAELEKGIEKLRSVYQDRDRLRALFLAASKEESWGGQLFARLRALRNATNCAKEADFALLRNAVKEELGRLTDRVCNLEQQIVISSPSPQEGDGEFDLLGETEKELHGVLRSRPDGSAYFIRFQSAPILECLEKMRTLLLSFDHARESQQAEAADRQLQSLFRQAKAKFSGDIEYHLMLAAIYSSRGLWFEAYVAAEQGLKLVSDTKKAEIAAVAFELRLIKGIALENWSLGRYGDLPDLARQFLGDAGKLILDAQALGAKGDPRVLRELATIVGCLIEVDRVVLASELPGAASRVLENLLSRLREVGSIPEEMVDAPQAFRELAERAYRGVSIEENRVHFVNTLLYALLEEREQGADIELQDDLALELEHLNTELPSINFLDTLAWYHFRRALRPGLSESDRVASLVSAGGLIQQAIERLGPPKRHRFYHALLGAHHRQIAARRAQVEGN